MKAYGWPGGTTQPDEHIRVRVAGGTGAYTFPAHRHNGYWEMTYVLSGEMRTCINGKHLKQNPGDLVLVRAQDWHALTGKDMTYANIAFTTEVVEALLCGGLRRPGDTLEELKTRPDALSGQIPASEREHFSNCLNELMQHPHAAGELALFCHVFYMAVCHGLLPPVPLYSSRSHLPDWLDACLRSMEQCPDVVVTLSELTAECGRSREHISRSFQKYLGTTPGAYLNQRHLDLASRLLTHTSMPVSWVAHKAGFDNLPYFNKLFNARFHMPPRRYRLHRTETELA